MSGLNPLVVPPFPIIDVATSATNCNITYSVSVSGTGFYVVSVVGHGIGNTPYDFNYTSNLLIAETAPKLDSVSVTNP